MKLSHRSYVLLAATLLTSLACSTVMQIFEPETTLDPSSLTAATEDSSQLQPTEQALPYSEGISYTLSKEEQTAIFEKLWNIVNDEYLYRDFNGIDWAGVRVDVLEEIKSGLSDQEFHQLMDHCLFILGDEHSIFLSPWEVAQEEASYTGKQDYGGIGIWIMPQPEKNRAVVLMVFPNTPAYYAGLKPHDSILAVDGQPIMDEEGTYGAALLGPAGSSINLTVQTPGREARQVVIERANITGSTPVPSDLIQSPQGKRIGYILIPSFSDSTIPEKVENALRRFNQDRYLDGLIVDDRLNPGGYSNIFEDTLRYFTGGTVGYFVNRQGENPVKIVRKDIYLSTQVPLVVLVGQGTMSFGEVFAGVLQSSGRATLLGMVTDGNVETLWGYDFEDGSRAWIAHDTFVPAKDRDADWEKTGIIPDLIISFDWGDFVFQDDPVIRAALEYFDGQP